MQLIQHLLYFTHLYFYIFHILDVKELPKVIALHPQLIYFNLLIYRAIAAIAAVLLVDINVL